MFTLQHESPMPSGLPSESISRLKSHRAALAFASWLKYFPTKSAVQQSLAPKSFIVCSFVVASMLTTCAGISPPFESAMSSKQYVASPHPFRGSLQLQLKTI